MTAQPGGANKTVLVPDFGDDDIEDDWEDYDFDLDLDDAVTYEALREVEDHELLPLREVAGDA